MKHILALSLMILSAQSSFGAEVQVRYRMTGLFQPDRVDDLRKLAGPLILRDTDVPAEVKVVDVNYDMAIVTFAYDAESKQFKDKKPEQVQERINDQLRNLSRGSFGITPLSNLKPEQLKQERITVEGLDCKGCAYSAYRAIASIEGVDRAVVSFKDGYVAAWIDPGKTNREALIKALKSAEVDVPEANTQKPGDKK